MEESDLLKLSGVSGGTIAIVLIVYRVLKSVLGKKLISNCCGRKIEVGVAVQAITPQPDVCLEIKTNPMIENAVSERDKRPFHRSESREDRRDESVLRTLQIHTQQERSSNSQEYNGQSHDNA